MTDGTDDTAALRIQHAHVLELAKEQTRQTKIRYVAGAAAAITLLGSIYKVSSEYAEDL